MAQKGTSQRAEHHADVVVIGAGGAGLTAALTSAECGASVILLEKNERVGGTTRLAVGSVSAAGTSLQKRKGIVDDPEAFDEDLQKFLGDLLDRDNAELRRKISVEAVEAFEWLRKIGVSFVGPFGEPPHRVPRMHNMVPAARASITALYKQVQKAGIQVFFETRAVRLIRNEAGRVVGVAAVRKGDEAETVFRAKKGVILATGDFSNNAEMKARYIRKEAAEVQGINESSTGDGHRMSEEIGAQLANMDVVFGPELRLVPPRTPPLLDRLPANLTLNRVLATLQRYSPPAIVRVLAKQMLTVRTAPSPKLFENGAILVNLDGERFADETGEPAYALPKQREGKAFLVFDEKVARRFSSGEYYISTAPGIAYAYWQDYVKSRPDLVYAGATIRELAGKMGVPPENLQQTVEAYNQSDDAARRGKLDTPRFYALGPVTSVFITTEGGLCINTSCQVLNSQGEPIEGLYAAGSVGQGGLVLAGHGLHILWAVVSGRTAGRAAAGGAV